MPKPKANCLPVRRTEPPGRRPGSLGLWPGRRCATLQSRFRQLLAISPTERHTAHPFQWCRPAGSSSRAPGGLSGRGPPAKGATAEQCVGNLFTVGTFIAVGNNVTVCKWKYITVGIYVTLGNYSYHTLGNYIYHTVGNYIVSYIGLLYDSGRLYDSAALTSLRSCLAGKQGRTKKAGPRDTSASLSAAAVPSVFLHIP